MAAPIFDARYAFMDALNPLARNDATLLAARFGIYRERRLTGALCRLFCCAWMHRMPHDFKGRLAVVPDGCSELVWSGGRLMVIGPDRTAAFPRLAPGETVLGLRFRPGAALGWLDLPLCELVGQAVPLGVLRDDVRDIEERLAAVPETAARMRLLQGWAIREALTATDAPQEMESLFGFLLDGRAAAGDISSAFSERTLRRRAHDHFGYGPKTLDRVLRLQRFLKRARDPEANSLAILALDTGYADQAHMTRDVREFTTMTPLDIRRQLSA